jgi:glycosyltransferase involved in cell wall biosynthesis
MPAVALLPWGDVVEDFLDPLGIGLDGLRDEMAGGWLFGFVDALGRVGVETSVVVISRSVEQVTRWQHGPTGAPLVILPMPRAYRALRRTVADPYAWTAADSARRAGWLGRLAAQPGRQLAPYLSTPLRLLGRELRRTRARAVLCQEYEYQRFDACVLLGRMLGVPVAATFQGGDATRTGLERLVRPLTMRAAHALVIAAEAEAGRVADRYGVPRARIARIPNPLDVPVWQSRARATTRAELGLPQDAIVVAWHGRVELHRKGLDLLLGAWSRVARAPGPPRRLLLVGTGRDADALRWWIREEALPGVMWVDTYVLDKERVAAYLGAADLYAFPSRQEGFPVAPIEAMAMGLPVVAAAAPGVAEIAPGGEASGVVVVPCDDGEAFTAALSALLEDADRRAELAGRARRRAADAFSLEAVGRQLRAALLGTASPTVHRCGGTNTPPSVVGPSTVSE